MQSSPRDLVSLFHYSTDPRPAYRSQLDAEVIIVCMREMSRNWALMMSGVIRQDQAWRGREAKQLHVWE